MLGSAINDWNQKMMSKSLKPGQSGQSKLSDNDNDDDNNNDEDNNNKNANTEALEKMLVPPAPP